MDKTNWSSVAGWIQDRDAAVGRAIFVKAKPLTLTRASKQHLNSLMEWIGFQSWGGFKKAKQHSDALCILMWTPTWISTQTLS